MNKDKVNVAVLVSGGGTNLQALIDAEKTGIIKSGKIALVVSNKPDVFALERAKNHGIKNIVIDKKQLGGQQPFETKLLQVLQENDIDVIVLAGFMSILTENVIKKYNKRIINVHPSLIPSFCGMGYYGLKVHEKALEKGVKVTVATVHYVNEIADDGEIIMQKAVKINKNDTPETLQLRVMKNAEWKILPRSLEKVCKNILKNKEN
ncbi:MAG: phosphoribosylglycinamide formyltransferase [Clostridia bacterium]|nr:phosphoribosylglycinamide formyltransferase [Clostridia bacterium]